MDAVYRVWGQYRNFTSRAGQWALGCITRHTVGSIRFAVAAMSMGIFGLIGLGAESGSIVALALVPIVVFEFARGH